MGPFASCPRIRHRHRPPARLISTVISFFLVSIISYCLIFSDTALLPATLFPIGSVKHRDPGKLTRLDAYSGLEDVVLVIKTGATESLRKLPAHFNTTLLHWPNVLLLSDYSEQIHGYEVYDALEVVSDDIRLNHTAFDLWRRLKRTGRSTLSLSDPEVDSQLHWHSTTGSDRQNGWNLARFMNLAMTVKAFELKPNAKWYVFIDADTFVSWSNLQRLIQYLDHTKPIYGGSQVAMGPGEFFAHGGSGYVLSQTALVKVVQHYRAQQLSWDSLVLGHAIGEVGLARALVDIEVYLTWMYPHFQGGDPYLMDFGLLNHGRRLWCYPAVTYHHLETSVISDLSLFERAWNQGRSAHQPFRHSDVYRGLILPLVMEGERINWDNSSDDLADGVVDVTGCQQACQRNSSCVQYTFKEGHCRTDAVPKAGYSKTGASGGWIVDRVQNFVESLDDQCKDNFLA